MTNPYYVDTTKQSTSELASNAAGSAMSGASAFASSGNPYVAAGTIIGGELSNRYGRVQNEKLLSDQLNATNVGGTSMNAFGMPSYNPQARLSDIQNVDTSNIGRFNVGKEDFMSPMGIVGSLSFKGLSSVLGGKKRRKKAEKAKVAALKRYGEMQQEFNETNLDYSKSQLQGLESGRKQMERQDRLYNIPTQLY